MAVLDSSALVAAIVGEPAQDEVARLFADENATHVIVSLNLGEVVDVLVRTRAREVAEVRAKIDALISIRAFEVVALDEATARRAGILRATHYHPRERNVSSADCVAAAAAERLVEALATCDPHQSAMARDEGIDVIALPDSSGRRP